MPYSARATGSSFRLIATRTPTRRSGVPTRARGEVDYRRLLELRSGLRRFQSWCEESAREAGLTPSQHDLLLAVKGHADPRGPSIGDLAGYLMLRHHSAVGLIDRAEVSGLVTRQGDTDDLRVVRIRLTQKGTRALERMAGAHGEELRRLAATRARSLWEDLDER